MKFLPLIDQICYAPIDIKNADIYLRDGYDNGTSTPTTTDIEPIGESTIALTGMATLVPDPAVTTGVSVKFGTDDTEYTVTTRTGGVGTDEVQTIDIDDDVSGGTFTLTYGGQTTEAIAYDAAAALVEAGLEALSTLGLGTATVTGTAPTWVVTFTGDMAATSMTAITGDGALLTGGVATDVEIANTVAGVAAVAEVQTLEATTAMTNGTWTLTLLGETTGDIEWDAPAASVEMALEALDGVAVGEITVAAAVGTWPELNSTLTCTFSGNLAGPQAEMVDDDSSTDGVLTVTETNGGVAGVQDVQTIQVNPSNTGGTFALTHAASETAPLTWDCTAAEVQAALIAAPTSETVTCTGGPFPASPIVVTWTATGTNTAITGTSENLTGGSALTVTVVETTPGVSATSTASIVITPVLVVATTAGGDVTFGGRRLSVKVGEGTVNYDESVTREYILNRGNIDTVRDGDDVPMDVSFDFVWEFITAVTACAVPTIEDVLKQTGEASTWLTTSADACEPYCIDVEIYYDPGCGGANTEEIILPYFRHEKLSHNLADSQISCTGKCNVTVATVTRGS